MAHDVFISHASQDRTVAHALCASLEARQIRCWIAPRDVLPGTEYAESIVDGIAKCRVFIVVFSAGANDSPQVRREVERAVSKGKVILPFRIEDVTPTRAMEFCLSNTHWLDAMSPPLEAHFESLGDTVERLMNSPVPATTSETQARRVPRVATGAAGSGYEYISPIRFLGLPLVHVSFGPAEPQVRRRVARGIVAIGDHARGVVAIGSVAMGGLALGGASIGVVPVGFLTLGLLPIGALAFGLVGAYGLLAVAPVALGAAAVGYLGHGGLVLAKYSWTHWDGHAEARDFFQPWVRPWLHIVLAILCLLSYLGPKLARSWVRSIEHAQGGTRLISRTETDTKSD